MKRTFNYTGRKRITRERISINFNKQNGRITSFTVDELNLDGLNLPSNAKVYVEAYYRTELKRFDFGTVGNRVCLSTINHLTDLAYPENLKFRILVVNPEDGKVLAHADRIAPEEPEGRKSILPVEFRDLGNEIWRVEYEGDEGAPVLCINSKIPNIENIARHDSQFLIYVYPPVIREILTHMVFVEGVSAPDDPQVGWHRDWIRFSRGIEISPPQTLDPEDEDFDKDEAIEWINNVVTAFANNHRSRFQEYLNKLEVVP